MNKLTCALLLTIPFLASADDHHEHHEHEHHEHEHEHEHHEHEHHEHGESRGVEVSEAAADLIGLTTTRVEARRLVSTARVTGRAVPDARAQRTVSVPLPGTLAFAVSAPATVKAGDTLFTVISPDAAAKYGELNTLAIRLAALEKAGARNAQLAADFAVQSAVYFAMTNGLLSVRPEHGEFAVTSPAAGRIDALLAAPGSFTERGTPALKFTAATAPSLLGLLPVSETVRLEDGLAARAADTSGLIRLDRTRNDGLVGVWFDFTETPSRIVRLGETVNFEIETDATETAVPALPDDCLFRDGITPAVFLRDEHDEDRFLVFAVETGLSAGGWTAVRNLPVGAEVARRGVYELKLALPSADGQKKAAGHFHADGRFHEGGHDDE